MKEDAHNLQKYHNKEIRADLVAVAVDRMLDNVFGQLVDTVVAEEWKTQRKLESQRSLEPQSFEKDYPTSRQKRKQRYEPERQQRAARTDAEIQKWLKRAADKEAELSWLERKNKCLIKFRESIFCNPFLDAGL